MTLLLDYLWTVLFPVLGFGAALFGIVYGLCRLFDKMAEPIHKINTELRSINRIMREQIEKQKELLEDK